MNHVMEVLSGIGILIGMYLVLSNATAATQIISVVATNSIDGIQVLQGRKTKIVG